MSNPTTPASSSQVPFIGRVATTSTIIASVILAFAIICQSILVFHSGAVWPLGLALALLAAPYTSSFFSVVATICNFFAQRIIRKRTQAPAPKTKDKSKIAAQLINAPSMVQGLPNWLTWLFQKQGLTTLIAGVTLAASLTLAAVNGSLGRFTLFSFGTTIYTNCVAPLQQIDQHLTTTPYSLSDLQADQQNAAHDFTVLMGVTAPDTKHGQLLTDCQSEMMNASVNLQVLVKNGSPTGDMALAAVQAIDCMAPHREFRLEGYQLLQDLDAPFPTSNPLTPPICPFSPEQ